MFRLIYLTSKSGSDTQFFEILQRNCEVILRSGGSEQNKEVSEQKSFDSVKLANVFVRKLLEEKRADGFTEVDEATNGFECITETAKANFNQNSTFIIGQIESLQQELGKIDKTRELLRCCKQKFEVSPNIGPRPVVSLNVGGKVISVRRELVDLHQHEGNLFALLSGRYDHLFPKDRNGRVFLDLDHHWVNPIINLARDMTMWDGVEEKTRPKLGCGSLYLSGMSVMGQISFSEWLSTSEADSEILKSLNTVNFIEVLPSWLGDKNKRITLKLLFRGSRDGFTAKAFHDKCDNHKDTISIIRDTDDCVFGGYADKVWKSTNEYGLSDKAFLFSLKRSGTETAKQFKIVGYKQHAIYNNPLNLCVFGNGADLAVMESCNKSFSRKSSYDMDEDSLSIGTYFTVAEIEVFQIVYHENPHAVQSVAVPVNPVPFLEANVSLYGDYFQESLQSMNQLVCELKRHQQLVITAEDELLSEVIAFREELKYVAKFAAVELSFKNHVKGKKSELKLIKAMLREIETNVLLLIDYKADSNTAVNSIVYINAAEDVIAVSKATLLQAPSGSILASMASDVWGHDLNSEGNIIQDVNPELFRLIIAHLRLKTLLLRVDRMSEVPPISVYEDQKAAMENLLAFYAMSEVPLKVLKRAV